MSLTEGERHQVGRRLLFLRRRLGRSQTQFGVCLGVSQTFVSDVERGRSAPSAQVVAGVERLGVNSEWLMTGEGEMLRATEGSALAVRDGLLTARQLRILGRVPAGYPGPSPAEEQVEGYFPMSYKSVPDPDAFCLRASSDSMSPEVEKGDLVVVSPALRTKVRSGDLVVVRVEPDDTWLKRIAISRGRAILYSANPRYPPIVVVDYERTVTIIGKVVCTVHMYEYEESCPRIKKRPSRV